MTVWALHPVDTARSADRQKQVLVLYSTRRDAQIAVVGDRELPRILGKGLSGGLDFYSEFIDQTRFPDPLHLRVKYEAQRFDIVIAMGDGPRDFVSQNRDDIFPDTPVVFFGDTGAGRPMENATGVIGIQNFKGTLDLATALQPNIRHVFVVTDDKEYESAARAQFRSFEPRLTITYLTGLVTKELENRLATLPADSIVYYLVVSRDGAGENFHPLEYLDRMAAVATAPIYSWVDSAMDHGIVGGSLKDQTAQTEAVGQLALRVLQGEPADSIPTTTRDLNVAQVDWRQLQRWGISEARVPSGTLIRFKEPSAWDRYRVYVLGAAAVLLAQTALIAGLLVQRKRRRHAEDQVRGSQAELRASYDRIRDLGSRLLNAQDTERSRIARELHDDISQQVALLAIDLEMLTGPVQTDREELVTDALTRAQGLAKSVHDLSHRLHPAKLRLIGLIPSLQALQREMSRAEVAITFTPDNVPSSVPPDLTLCLFRVVQEALQNALKYSKARQVSVHLRGTPKGIELTIVDDGVGFDVNGAWGKGLGLISMRERLEALGGTLAIRSKAGAGTRLEVVVPLQVAESAETTVMTGLTR
jgi:signal transduction histidine kinase